MAIATRGDLAGERGLYDGGIKDPFGSHLNSARPASLFGQRLGVRYAHDAAKGAPMAINILNDLPLSCRRTPEGWATTKMTIIKLAYLPHGTWRCAIIDWKKIRNRAETVALLSIMAAGYLAPALVWSATDRTLQLSPCSCEEATASDDEDDKLTDCSHLERLHVRDVQAVTND